MPNKKSDYHVYTHSIPGIDTMGSFVSDSNSLSLGVGLDIVKVLNYEDENGNLNLDNLIIHYSEEEKKKFQSLIDQLKNSLKQQTNNTTVIDNQAIPVSIINSQQVDKKISVKKNAATTLNKNISDLQLFVQNSSVVLDKKTKDFLDKISIPEVKALFTKFVYQVHLETNYIVIITSSRRPLSTKEPTINPHFSGLAIDFNLRQKNSVNVIDQAHFGTSSTGSTTLFTDEEIKKFKPVWEATGAPDIARNLGLRWGGDFKNGAFDPVHIDAVNYYDIPDFGQIPSLINPITSSSTFDNINENQNSQYFDLPLKVGTIFNLPIADIDRELLITESNQVINSTDFGSFLARELFFLLRDKSYEREFVPVTGTTVSKVKEIFPYMSVWIWSRALSLDIEGNYEHKIINITPYIASLNTSVGKNGGSFSIELPAIESEMNNNDWRFSDKNQKASTKDGGDYVSHNFLHYQEDGELKRNRFFFEKAFQQNDIVFIRFERLVLENGRQNLDTLETISINQLPNQIFDMIGLIDDPIITTQPSHAHVSINISGRDLVKLIIEDGVYFYPYDFTSEGIFANETGASNQRLNRFNGQILSRFQVQNKTIDKSLKYIMNALSSIDICPTDLFSGYSNGIDRVTQTVFDKRSKAYQLDNDSRTSIQDAQRKIDSDKSKVLDKINNLRQSNGIIEGSATIVYNIINQFLNERIDNGEIVEFSSFHIKSWSQVIFQTKTTNQLPIELGDLLFFRNRTWTNNKNLSIQDLPSKDIVQSMEDLFSEVNQDEIKQNRSFVFSQLLRINQSTFSSSTNSIIGSVVYQLQDLISEVKNLLNQSSTFDGISYGSEFSRTLINTVSNKQVSFRDSLFVIDNKYQLILKQGKSIRLVIINKQIADLSAEEMSVFDGIYQIIKEEKDLQKKQQGSFQLLPVNGIWQIVKLVIDDSVKNRLLADASIGNEHGSLINAIRKICQEPFCEFYTDTYGDQFYFIVRKRPFDKESFLSMLEGRIIYEKYDPVNDSTTIDAIKKDSAIDTLNIQTKLGKVFSVNKTTSSIITLQNSNDFVNQSIILPIEEIDVLGDTLTYSREAYSWYRLQLKNLISGSDADMSFAYLKAVYFNEFADIFGSKPLDISTNYIPCQNIVDKNKSLPTAYFIEQGIRDLKYLIESHAYLPFTRQGTITTNGDRRYKVGTFVKLKSTNEIFYVDHVTQEFSIDDSAIDRKTTLHVSRGMIEKYIKGVQVGNNNISYFNICNLPIDDAVFTSQQKGNLDFNRLILSRWKVNPVVFNFFIKKMQAAKVQELSLLGDAVDNVNINSVRNVG